MSIQVLPAQRTGGQDFVDAFTPYIQLAFQAMMKRQLEEQQRQRNIQQAQQMMPEAFTSDYEAATRGQKGVNVNLQQGYQPTPEMWQQIYQGQTGKTTVPSQYMKFMPEQAQKYPGMGINFQTGEMEYKVPSNFGTMPIINITSEGKAEQIGTAPKGAKIVSGMGEPSPAQQKFEAEQKEKTQQLEEKSQFIKDSASDALNTIGEIEKGIGHFGLFGQLPSIPGTERYTWETNINKLLSGKMIDLMTKMKEASKTGATGFGQLSEKEGQILREASTALKRGLTPEKAQEYLNSMKATLQKVMQGGQQLQQTGLEYQKYLQAIGGQ